MSIKSILVVLIVLGGVALAEAGLFCFGNACDVPCDDCSTGCCQPKYENETIKKAGFETECETVCVPKVHFPWQDPCAPRCAYAIRVNRLKKKTIECGTKCVLKWEPLPKPAAKDAAAKDAPVKDAAPKDAAPKK